LEVHYRPSGFPPFHRYRWQRRSGSGGVWRTEAGLNPRELAKLAGIAFEQPNRIERGEVTPTIGAIESIERGFRKMKAAAKGER